MLNSNLLQKPVVIIGAGSIGERHIKNLSNTGFKNILVYRQRNLPFRNIGNASVKVVLDWHHVIALKPFAAIIATPSSQHLQQCIDCANAGMHVLVEKPLWHKLFDKESLINLFNHNKLLLQVGYMLRYHPLLIQPKEIIQQKKYGNLISIQTYWGEYLPDWHPWENYANSYAAKKEFGGGAALTLSHDIDVANFLSNSEIQSYQALPNHASNLQVNTNSAFDVNIQYSNKATAHVHVNFCQIIPQRWYKLILDEAVIDIDYYKASISISTKNNFSSNQLDQFDRNELFIKQQIDFFERIESADYAAFTEQQIINAHTIIQICNNE